MKILVIDDERWIRKGIVKMLESADMGIEGIIEADSVKSGWEAFMRERPQVVISDVKFPVDTGCLLCGRIYREAPDTKIIMLSGYGEFDYVKAALQYKAVDYLLKPVDKEVLHQAVARAFRECAGENRSDRDNRLAGGDGFAGESRIAGGNGFAGESSLAGDNEKSGRKTGSSRGEELIRKVMDDIHRNYSRQLSLKGLAARYYVNEAYLSSLFTRTAGTSLMIYIMRVRVEKAKSLLMMTRLSITDISLQVGYENARYFTRVFKKLTDETPREFRLRLDKEMKDEA